MSLIFMMIYLSLSLPDLSLLQWNNSSLPNKSISFRNTGKDDNLALLRSYGQYGTHQLQPLMVGRAQRIIQNDRCPAILCHYHGTRQPVHQRKLFFCTPAKGIEGYCNTRDRSANNFQIFVNSHLE